VKNETLRKTLHPYESDITIQKKSKAYVRKRFAVSQRDRDSQSERFKTSVERDRGEENEVKNEIQTIQIIRRGRQRHECKREYTRKISTTHSGPRHAGSLSGDAGGSSNVLRSFARTRQDRGYTVYQDSPNT